MKRWLPLFVLVLFIALGAACSFSPSLLTTLQAPTPQASAKTLVPTGAVQVDPASLALDQNLSAIYERVNPGVVSIVITTADGSASGSGFVYDKEGHILTNYHVVEGAQQLEVDFPDGNKVYGDVIATDLDSDLAVIHVDVSADKLVPLSLGDSNRLKVGDVVVAIGNPFRLSSTMTLGIISAKGRVLDSIRTAEDSTPFTAGDIIQTDAAINPGNSGGPLLDLAGEVIGINRAIRTTGTTAQGDPVNSGIGFAVSINIVRKVVPSLIANGSYDYPFMGISSSANDFTLPEWEALGFTQTYGAYLTEVTQGGPAEQAGLVAGDQTTSIPGLYAGGDLIQAVDGHAVFVYGDLVSYIMTNKSPGDTIVLTIIRNGSTQEVTLTLGKRP